MDARAWGRWWRTSAKSGVLEVLSRERNPIGGPLPADEYECAAGPIGHLLRDAVLAAQLADALADHRSHFGDDPDPEADMQTAESLIAWYRTSLDAAGSGEIPEH